MNKRKFVLILLSSILLMNISKDTKKEDIYNFSNIIADSEVVLTKIYGGAPGIFKIGNRVEEPPQKIINIATCKKGTVIICEKYFWNENKHEERNYRGLLKNYLNIWEKIKKYDVFAMETKGVLVKRCVNFVHAVALLSFSNITILSPFTNIAPS